MYLETGWGEGGKLNARAKQVPNTRVATLDTLAYQDKLFGHDPVIDVLKIDAETVDTAVIGGASRLLSEERIRTFMWEMQPSGRVAPFVLPHLTGSDHPVSTYQELVAILDEHAGMTCYLPGVRKKDQWTFRNHVRLTGCPEVHSFAHRCKLFQNNGLCVHRQLARELYHAMENASLIYDDVENLLLKEKQ